MKFSFFKEEILKRDDVRVLNKRLYFLTLLVLFLFFFYFILGFSVIVIHKSQSVMKV